VTVRRFFTGFLLYTRGMARRTEAPAADLSLCKDQSSRIWRHTGNPHPPRPADRALNSNAGRRGAPHRRTPSSGRAFFGRRRYADDRVGQRCGYQKHRNLRGQPGFFLRDRGATYEEMLAVSDNFEAGERNAARQIIDY
jgi:hypothetical protein